MQLYAQSAIIAELVWHLKVVAALQDGLEMTVAWVNCCI